MFARSKSRSRPVQASRSTDREILPERQRQNRQIEPPPQYTRRQHQALAQAFWLASKIRIVQPQVRMRLLPQTAIPSAATTSAKRSTRYLSPRQRPPPAVVLSLFNPPRPPLRLPIIKQP